MRVVANEWQIIPIDVRLIPTEKIKYFNRTIQRSTIRPVRDDTRIDTYDACPWISVSNFLGPWTHLSRVICRRDVSRRVRFTEGPTWHNAARGHTIHTYIGHGLVVARRRSSARPRLDYRARGPDPRGKLLTLVIPPLIFYLGAGAPRAPGPSSGRRYRRFTYAAGTRSRAEPRASETADACTPPRAESRACVLRGRDRSLPRGNATPISQLYSLPPSADRANPALHNARGSVLLNKKKMKFFLCYDFLNCCSHGVLLFSSMVLL